MRNLPDLAMPIKTEFVTLSVDDGTSMKAYVARPEGTPKAGLIVFQEIFGVNPHIRDITERFGREGYLAIAPELFHRTGPGFESGYTDMGPGFEHAMKTTDAGLAADIRAAHHWLQSQAKLPIAAIGYCMGGRVATIAAMTVPLACGVSYYGGGIAPNPRGPGILDRLKDLNAPMLYFWGGLDQHITPEHVQMITGKLREAKKTFVNVEFSDADHGFFCDARASYNAKAAAEAWPLTLAYLATHTQKAAGA
jgi:carboxymethylenebutenolidase